MVKHEYPALFEDDPEWKVKAEDLARRTHEFSQFLVHELGVTDVGAKFDGKVTFHFACHLRMLNYRQSVEKLIEKVQGTTYLPLHRQDQCCGFGGSFAVRYPEISGAMVEDKMQCILRTEADVVVSTDAGCLMNIGGRLHREGKPVEVLHIAELLERR